MSSSTLPGVREACMEDVLRRGSPARAAAVSRKELGADLYPRRAACREPPRTVEPGVVMLADVFTNYGAPERGMAAIRVFRASVASMSSLVRRSPTAARRMSQGMIDTARAAGGSHGADARPYLDAGRKIVVVEPSVLAMLRFDLRHLLDDHDIRREVAAQHQLSSRCKLSVRASPGVCRLDLHADVSGASQWPHGTQLFYHSHCQQRTCNAACADDRRTARRAASMWSRRRWNAAAWPAASATSRLLRLEHGCR